MFKAYIQRQLQYNILVNVNASLRADRNEYRFGEMIGNSIIAEVMSL